MEPRIHIPEIEVPKLRVPDLEVPKVKQPELEVPKTATPEVKPEAVSIKPRPTLASGEGTPLPKPAMSDVVHELMVSNMLAGPHTHIFNAVENAMSGLTAPMETATRAAFSVGRSPENKTYMREAVYGAFGMAHGYMAALKWSAYRLRAMLPGVAETADETLARLSLPDNISEVSKISEGARNIAGDRFFGPGSTGVTARMVDSIGAIANVPGTALNAVDTMFKIVHYNRKAFEDGAAIWAKGGAKTFKQGYEQVLADPNWAKSATKEAEYWTLQGEPESHIKWILSDSADKVPGLRFIVPFRRAVANLYEKTLERSPLILMSPTLSKKLFSADPIVKDTARSKLMFGLSALTMMSMTLSDKLVGSAPTRNRMAKNAWQRENGTEDMLWIDDEHTIGMDFRNMGVYGSFLKVISGYKQWNANLQPNDLYADEKAHDSSRFYKELGDFIAPVFNASYDNHWSKNITEFMAVVNDAITNKDPEKLVFWLTRNLGVRTIPIVGAAYVRDAAVAGDPWAKDIHDPTDILYSQIPSLRKLVDTSWTWDGLPMLHSSMYKGAKRTMAVTDTYGKQTALDTQIVKLGVEFPKPSPTYDVPATGSGLTKAIDMNKEEWTRFNSMRNTGSPEYGIPPFRTFLTSRVKLKDFLIQQPYKRAQAKIIVETWGTYNEILRNIIGADVSKGSIRSRYIEQIDKQKADYKRLTELYNKRVQQGVK